MSNPRTTNKIAALTTSMEERGVDRGDISAFVEKLNRVLQGDMHTIPDMFAARNCIVLSNPRAPVSNEMVAKLVDAVIDTIPPPPSGQRDPFRFIRHHQT